MEGRRGVWLRLISDWLGSEFSRLRTSVNDHVELFKADHIDRITDLPAPAAVVRRLFPHSMILLMLRWMDGSPGSSVDTVDSSHPEDSLGSSRSWTGLADHSYVVADGGRDSKLFSFIQLILEFANGCLVSGIAHVLYPRLLNAQL